MEVIGDLNMVGGPQPLDTLLNGDIVDESTYGADSSPDWDGSALTDAHPLHNAAVTADYTWQMTTRSSYLVDSISSSTPTAHWTLAINSY